MVASRTTPTLCVLVMRIGPSMNPDSSIHAVPVISPLPFCENHAPNAGRVTESSPRGRTAVTPVRTATGPALSGGRSLMMVECPTVTPFTSVMAFSGPGVPPNGTRIASAGPRRLARPADIDKAAATPTRAIMSRRDRRCMASRPFRRGLRGSDAHLTPGRAEPCRVADSQRPHLRDCPGRRASLPQLQLEVNVRCHASFAAASS
jgi:hypothetical protein